MLLEGDKGIHKAWEAWDSFQGLGAPLVSCPQFHPTTLPSLNPPVPLGANTVWLMQWCRPAWEHHRNWYMPVGKRRLVSSLEKWIATCAGHHHSCFYYSFKWINWPFERKLPPVLKDASLRHVSVCPLLCSESHSGRHTFLSTCNARFISQFPREETR